MNKLHLYTDLASAIGQSTTTPAVCVIEGISKTLFVPLNAGSNVNIIQDNTFINYERLVPNSNQIWYTTSDGSTITPHDITVFGANIISNTYDNRKGVITFDGDITSIGSSAFSFCVGLASITIPSSVTSIGDETFSSCAGLTVITIPSSITEIGDGAFLVCVSLSTITFTGTVEQWNAITFGNNWHLNAPATEVICSDGTVTL